MDQTLKVVVDRLVREVGLPRATSARIATKLNELATEVDWAKPVRKFVGRSKRAQTSIRHANKDRECLVTFAPVRGKKKGKTKPYFLVGRTVSRRASKRKK